MLLLGKMRYYKVLFHLVQNVANQIKKWNNTNLNPDYLMQLIGENMTTAMSVPPVSTPVNHNTPYGQMLHKRYL